jgi:Fe-S oxidoreductase
VPWLANVIAGSHSLRHIVGKVFGINAERAMPVFARERFDRWFKRREHSTTGEHGRVVLWDDTFTRYHEPNIGIAAVKVLEAAGCDVTLPQQRKCCGRPAFSIGNLDEAQKLGAHNLAMLAGDDSPIIFLEPSCYSMFVEDYRELGLAGAAEIAARCVLFEDFLENLLNNDPQALHFDHEQGRVAIHSHCHAKALTNTNHAKLLAGRLPNRTVAMLDTGCCGMAGSFGMIESKHGLSVKVAAPLVEQIKGQPFGTTIVLSGTSCRHQVQDLVTVRTLHMAEVLAEALA